MKVDMKPALPCQFCGSEIRHIGSWALSFNPPRLWHEWHHVDDNREVCHLLAYNGKIVFSATDDVEIQNYRIERWNKSCISHYRRKM